MVCREKAREQFVRFLAGAGELMRDSDAKRFGPLFGLAGEPLDTRRDFFAQGAAFFAVPLLGAGQIVAQTDSKASCERTRVSRSRFKTTKRGKNGKNNSGKHFRDALFYCSADTGRSRKLDP